MSFHHLKSLFAPHSIAVVGASSRPRRIGHIVMRNLLAGGFAGAIMPVNPKREAVAGVLTYPDIAALPRTPDLAILCTPAATVPGLIAELGQRGCRAAIVMSGFLGSTPGDDGRPLAAAVLETARRHGVRLLGGGTLGIVVPGIGLNATFSQMPAGRGHLGFVSQSDAVGTLVLDWARPKQVGFSHFVSLGDGLDVGFGDVLDYLGSDPDTRAILLYFETIQGRRGFMAAARAAARNKPVVAIKAGRAPRAVPGRDPGPRIAHWAGEDAVYDAVLHRAGILRVDHLDEAFGAVETVLRARPMSGDRLVAISNGGGAGTMAEDSLYLGGYAMPALSEPVRERLRTVLPRDWDGGNPINLRVDGSAARYVDAYRILVEEREADAILAMHSPNALTDGGEIAEGLIEMQRKAGGNLFACWIGEESVAGVRQRFAAAGIPAYDDPGHAARAFLHMVHHRDAREVLMQVPPSEASGALPDAGGARAVIAAALAAGRGELAGEDAGRVLAAYDIALDVAARDAGGGRSLQAGMFCDPVFGPLIACGEAGRRAAVGLPPLNLPLARDLVARSRAAAASGIEPHLAEGDCEAVAQLLVRLSQLVVDQAAVAGIDLQLYCRAEADAGGGVAVADARLWLDAAPSSSARLTLRPYPRELEEHSALRDGRPVLFRPIRPEDEDDHYTFLSRLSQQDIVYRFFHHVDRLPRRDMARLTQIDYDREMAFIATARNAAGEPETLGVVRIVADPDHYQAEFAIVIRSDLKGQGLGKALLTKMIEYSRRRGIRYFTGDVMGENQPMLRLLKSLGFRTARAEEPGIVRATLDLQPSDQAASSCS